MRFATVLLVTSAIVSEIECSDILFGVMHFSKSHIISMLPLAESLVARGHNVTIYVAVNEPTKPMGKGVNFLFSQLPPITEEDVAKFSEMIWTMDFGPLLMAWPFFLGNKAMQDQIDRGPTPFWTVANASWDFMFVDELFSQSSYAIGLLNKAHNGRPFGVFSTADMLATFASVNSLHRQPTTAPSFYTKHSPFAFDVGDFWHRLGNMVDFLSEYFSVGILSEWMSQRALANTIGLEAFSWYGFFREASLVVADCPERWSYPVPLGNELINIGATCADQSTKETLSDELRSFVDDPTSKGTIYIAFGSNVQWHYAPRHAVDAFLVALAALKDYRIIWGYKGPALDVGKHVFVTAWAPQIAILNHNRTKLFISHGGLKSLKEAICSETPVVFMSIFAEQTHNALVAHQLGFAEYVNKLNVTGEALLSRARAVLDDERYTLRVKTVRATMVDRIAAPLDEGVFWVEKAIRYGRHPLFFHRQGIHQSWFTCLYGESVIILLLYLAFMGGK